MNNVITIEKAARAICGIQTSVCIDRTTRDAAQWACGIIAELRQQVELGHDATMDELYRATVNLLNKELT